QSTQQIPLQNSGFETRPTNLSTNATSEFVLLDTSINVIPGWSYNGTVRYVTSGGNVSLPGNGHGMQLGPNGMINQTFKPDDSYDYVLTFTLASSSAECANNSTAVNVSGPSVSKVFFFEESLGNETWQTRAYSLGWSDFQTGSMSVQIQSVVNSSRGNTNTTCWPIIDTLLITGIQTLRFCPDIILTDVPTPLNFLVTDNDFVNSGFEVGPAFIENSTQGILLEADPNNDPFNRAMPPFLSVQSPLQEWSILGTVKYIDSKHYAVPRGRGAVELVCGNPSGIIYNINFLKHGQVTIDFIMGDANDSCVGDFVVYLQVGNTIWNFTMRSIGVGSREKHSVTFKAEFSNTDWVPVTATLQNPDFESPPTNLTTNVTTSQFVLLDTRTNVIPGWSFNGTVWYVTSGGNVSLPKNGHGMRLGPNGMINQTFKSNKGYTYDYVLTFTLAPSSMGCANNFTAVNVSGPTDSQVFSYKESVGTEMWQTYAFSIGNSEIRKGVMGIQIQSVVTGSRGNITCWPIVDTFIITSIEDPRWYGDNGFVNSGFEVGPAFIENSSQGILLQGDPKIDPFNRFQSPFHSVQSPLQGWSILGTVKYIDSKHYAVPRGRGAVELVSGYPSGIVYNIYYFTPGQTTIDFIMGDANNSCVGDFVVYLQVGNTIWNFTMRSIGVGSREKHSVTFKAEFSNTEWVPVSFYSYNETRTSNHQVLCGPVIDSTVIRFSSGFSSGLRSEYLHRGFVTFSFLLAVTFPFLL
ncbi:hypothetical protein Tco_0285380, partial [Tanacetum coccineum]